MRIKKAGSSRAILCCLLGFAVSLDTTSTPAIAQERADDSGDELDFLLEEAPEKSEQSAPQPVSQPTASDKPGQGVDQAPPPSPGPSDTAGAGAAASSRSAGGADAGEMPGTTAQGAGGAELLPTIPVAGRPENAPSEAAPRPRKVGITIEEIVVTAQKREESINQVPIAISALKGDDMKALGITDTRSLQSLVPGFTAADNGYNTPVYTLRGIGYNDTTYTATSTVGVYIDEISMPYSVMTKGANLDLERVEVLKGPQGTLFGRNTTGGAINYIARKPTEEFEWGVSGTYGSFKTAELEGFASGALTDELRARVAARAVRAWEGWQYSNTRPDDTMGEKEKASARAILDWRPKDDLFFRLMADGWIDKSDPQAPQAIAVAPQNPFFPNTPLIFEPGAVPPELQAALLPLLGANATLAPQVKEYPFVSPDTDDMRVADWSPCGASGQTNCTDGIPWGLNDSYWNVALTSRYDLSDTTHLTVIGAHGEVLSDGSAIPNSGLNVNNTEQVINAGIKTTSLELRVDGVAGDAVTWLAGANGSYDDGYEHHHVYVPSVSAVFPDPVTGQATLASEGIGSGITQARALGVFSKVDWQATDTLQASIGLRYSTEKRDFYGCFAEPESSQGVGFGNALTVVSLLFFQSVNNPPKGAENCTTVDENGQSGPYTDTLKEHNVSGRAALTWTPTDLMLYYVSYSRGFKSGGFPVVNASFQEQYKPTTQEKLLALEVGGKITWIEGFLHTNFAVFDYGYTNKQLLSYFRDPVFGVLPIAVNVPESTVRGAELDIQFTPLEGLFLSAAGAYIDTQVDRFVGLNASGEEQDYAGRSFNFTPKFQYSLLADYSWPLNDSMNAGLGIDYSFTGESNATIEGNPLYELRENGILGARIRVGEAEGRWNVLLWGRNLTNEFSALGVFRTGDAVARTTGMTRTYGITLSYSGF